MTVKRRVRKLENELGAKSNLHFLMVYARNANADEPPETQAQALKRLIHEKGLIESDLGVVIFFGGESGCTEKRFCSDAVKPHDLIGYEELGRAIELAGKNIMFRSQGQSNG